MFRIETSSRPNRAGFTDAHLTWPGNTKLVYDICIRCLCVLCRACFVSARSLPELVSTQSVRGGSHAERLHPLPQEVLAHCGKLEPLLLPAYACMLRGIGKLWDKTRLHDPMFRRAVQAEVATFEKAAGVKPSLLQLVKAMNSTGWKAEQCLVSPVSGHLGDQHLKIQSLPDLDTAKMDPSPSGGSHHQMKEKDGVAEWYEISWPLDRSSVTACSCSGNCLSTCPARNDQCPNPAASARQTWSKRVISSCTACRCRVLGCLSFARRPFGPHSSAQNHGKCSKHWVFDDTYVKNQFQKHSHHSIDMVVSQQESKREPAGNRQGTNREPTVNQQRTNSEPAPNQP